MIDILYLAKGRPEFTEASFHSLIQNTNWSAVRKLFIYTDGDKMPIKLLHNYWMYSCKEQWHALSDAGVRGIVSWSEVLNGPVAIMSHFVSHFSGPDLFAKIDNDVMVPPGWLEQCLQVMEASPELGLLGIEPPASRTPAPWAQGIPAPAPELWKRKSGSLTWGEMRGYAVCDSIGGIGLMRRSAFAGRRPMRPHATNGVGGFTDWQLEHKDVVKGWVTPPLNLFLLDRLPFEPWASLSKKYIAEGIQRPWTNYPASASHLWEWWLK